MKKTDVPVEPQEIANAMSEKEMAYLLIELRSSKFWPAILKFDRLRYAKIGQVLFSVDPFKLPTQTARAQGEAIGVFALENESQVMEKQQQNGGEETGPEISYRT